MKLIIDIDEDVYKLFTGNGQGIKVVRFNLENTLKNGTPLEEELEKIRDEIADIDNADYDFEGYYKAVTDALQIIDKYKAESETERYKELDNPFNDCRFGG